MSDSADRGATSWVAPKVFISYAKESEEHIAAVTDFWLFLNRQSVLATMDEPAAQGPRDWPIWMLRQVRDSRFVLIIASPEYRRRADGDAGPTDGRGVQWEARLIREEYYRDQEAGLAKFLPVLLPGHTTDEIPIFLGPTTCTHYAVSSFTPEGSKKLLNYLRGEWPSNPALGTSSTFETTWSSGPSNLDAPNSQLQVTSIIIDIEEGTVAGETRTLGRLDDQIISTVITWVPQVALGVWHQGLQSSSAEVLARAGLALMNMLLDNRGQSKVNLLIESLKSNHHVEITVTGPPHIIGGLPLELLRLSTSTTAEPIALKRGVALRRLTHKNHTTSQIRISPTVGLAGPLRILVLIANQNEESEERYEAIMDEEMEVLFRLTDSSIRMRILEKPTRQEVAEAIASASLAPFHVVHICGPGHSRHRSFFDHDGTDMLAAATDLRAALTGPNGHVPLIVLSDSSDTHPEAPGRNSLDLALSLLQGGADRVIAFQNAIDHDCVNTILAALYSLLAKSPPSSVAFALAEARREARDHLVIAAHETGSHPFGQEDWASATLLCAADDYPLLNSESADVEMKWLDTRTLGFDGWRYDVPRGCVIGRKSELLLALAVMRRQRRSTRKPGGVALVGIGGIGKTLLARRVVTMLRHEGWREVVHVGAWDPTRLLDATATALEGFDETAVSALRRTDVSDMTRLALLPSLIHSHRLLLVFDEFERNYTTDATALADPALEALIESCALSAGDPDSSGALLITCRYSLPGTIGTLLEMIALPSLTSSETDRLCRRLPALRDMPAEERNAILRTIGGHPRLIELTDALLRSGQGQWAGSYRPSNTAGLSGSVGGRLGGFAVWLGRAGC